jgi:hypothetical protein
MRSLQVHKGHRRMVLLAFLMAFLIQGCAHHGEQKCAQADVMCPDKSMPHNGKCADGSEALLALACLQKPKSCGSECYSWQLGKPGCDTNNSSLTCQNYTNPTTGACSCRCM